jgi:hypothetical protein
MAQPWSIRLSGDLFMKGGVSTLWAPTYALATYCSALAWNRAAGANEGYQKKSDKWIGRMAESTDMIEPFEPERNGL